MRKILILIMLLYSSSALSGVVADQSMVAVPGSGAFLEIGGPSGQKIAQTFVAGISGRLDHVTLVLSCSATSDGDLTVEIQEVDAGGEPNGSVLGSTSVGSSTLYLDPIWFQDIPVLGVTLTAGTKYAIVISAEPNSDCDTREGVHAGNPFSYAPGGGYSAVPPAPDAWVRFDVSADDIPFYTWMYVNEPLFCEFKDANGLPNDWLPNHIPVCGCVSDDLFRSNRCWFALPDFMLWRDMPLPWEEPQGKALWQLVPHSSNFSGVNVFESWDNNNFFAEEVVFPAGLSKGKIENQKVKYSGDTDRTTVEIFFEGPEGPASVEFETFLADPN